MSPSALWQGSSKAWSQPQFFTDEEIFSFQLSQGVAWLQGHQQKLRFGGVYPNFRHSFLAILEVCYMWDHLGMRQEARYPWLEHAHFGGGHPAKAKYKVLWNQSKEFNMSFWTEGPHRLYMGVSMGFLKWGYPQIIHLNRIFHCKSSSYWGTPMAMEPLHRLQGSIEASSLHLQSPAITAMGDVSYSTSTTGRLSQFLKIAQILFPIYFPLFPSDFLPAILPIPAVVPRQNHCHCTGEPN